ncbi:MAG: patatin-like phospholipase family protein [Acidobacteriota bacterium]|nr:patatin-like phospholipase family protein [Acidobacteriota bacterium]
MEIPFVEMTPDRKREALSRLEKEITTTEEEVRMLKMLREIAQGAPEARVCQKHGVDKERLREQYRRIVHKRKAKARKYRILSFDGGGDKTIISLAMLKRLEEKAPFLKNIDMITGISAGGVNALIMALAGKRGIVKAIDLCLDFWLDKVTVIPHLWTLLPGILGIAPFSPNSASIENFKSLLAKTSDAAPPEKLTLAHVCDYDMAVFVFNLKAQASRLNYSQERLLKNLRKKFPDDCHQFGKESLEEVKIWLPFSYSNMRSIVKFADTDLDASLLHAMLGTSAAPIIFPVFRNTVDGGIFAANPSIGGLTRAMSHLSLSEGEQPPNREPLPEARLENIEILSLGVGMYDNYIHAHNPCMGWGAWIFDPHNPLALMNMVLGSTYTFSNIVSAALLKDAYFRLDTKLNVKTYQLNSKPVKLKMLRAGMDAWIGTAYEWLHERGWTTSRADD